MKRMSIVGMCIVAAMALVSLMAAGTASAAPELGQCVHLGKYTEPKEKKGKYEDPACLIFSHKEKKGKLEPQEKGNYEWRSGAPGPCEKLTKPKGNYEDSACTKLHEKFKKGVGTPDKKGMYEKNGNLVILPKWDTKMLRRTRHFCGRAHASRYVERWIAALALNVASDTVLDPGQKSVQPLLASQFISDEEDEATAMELAARYR